MSKHRQSLGRWGEAAAAAFLEKRGDRILARNVRTEYGEIDLVTRRGDRLVFVEVKTRTSRAFGPPETAMTPKKQAHLLAAAQAYLQERPGREPDWQIDVIAVERFHPDFPPQITHFENAL